MFKIDEVDATGSTNTDLLDQPFVSLSPVPQIGGQIYNPRALLAWNQTAGRGQRGRQWTSDDQQSLTFSLSIEITAGSVALEGFSLFVGLCVLEGIEQWWPCDQSVTKPKLQLKWPNDLVVDLGKGVKGSQLGKIGGVLIESKTQGAQQRIVIGIGVNVFRDITEPNSASDVLVDVQPIGDKPSNFQSEHAVALPPNYLISNRALNASVGQARNDSYVSRRALASSICAVFTKHWRVFANRGFGAYERAFNVQHALHLQPIQWLNQSGQWTFGQCIGAANDGALQVQLSDQSIEHLYSSSVTVRLSGGIKW